MINEIVGYVGADLRAMYWTDLQRRPIEIIYHTIYESNTDYEKNGWLYIFSKIENKKIISHEISIEDTTRDLYYDKDFVGNIVKTKFEANNQLILHIQCAYRNVSIRQIDSNKYVLVDTSSYGRNSEIIHSSKIINY